LSSAINTLWLRVRAIAVCTIAVCAGLLAAWAVHQHIQMREQELAEQTAVDMRSRLVAAVDLTSGTRLQIDHLAIREIPLPWVPGHSFDPDAVDELIGRSLTADLNQGDVVLAMHIKAHTEPSISDLVAAGRRAVTLPANDIYITSGLLQANDLIDLYVSFMHHGQQLTAPLAQGLRVLAVGGGADIASSITFDASEQEAIKLVAARHTGSLTAMLRHRGDKKMTAPTAPGDLAALMGLETSVALEPAPVPVSILYGDRVETDVPSEETHPTALSDRLASMKTRSEYEEAR